MKLLPWYQRTVEIDDGEETLFSQGCSSAQRARWYALVGGTVYVTTHHLVFIPNVLAALIGRRPWTFPIAHVQDTETDMLHATRFLDAMPALRVVVEEPDGTTQVRTLVMTRSEHVADLAAAIEEARRRTG